MTFQLIITSYSAVLISKCTAELHLYGLMGKASHPEMQKIRIIGFFFEIGLRWESEVEKIYIFLQTAVLGYIFVYVQINNT